LRRARSPYPAATGGVVADFFGGGRRGGGTFSAPGERVMTTGSSHLLFQTAACWWPRQQGRAPAFFRDFSGAFIRLSVVGAKSCRRGWLATPKWFSAGYFYGVDRPGQLEGDGADGGPGRGSDDESWRPPGGANGPPRSGMPAIYHLGAGRSGKGRRAGGGRGKVFCFFLNFFGGGGGGGGGGGKKKKKGGGGGGGGGNPLEDLGGWRPRPTEALGLRTGRLGAPGTDCAVRWIVQVGPGPKAAFSSFWPPPHVAETVASGLRS